MSRTLGSLELGNTIEIPVVPEWQERFGKTIVWKIVDKNHAGYPSNSVTLITDKIIQIMPFDAREPKSRDGEIKYYGDNRYIYSNMHQWLNSSASAGKWYSPTHSTDEPPIRANLFESKNPYNQWAGFLAMLDSKFVLKLMNTSLKVKKSPFWGNGYDTFNAKIFFAAYSEVIAKSAPSQEGTILEYFALNDFATHLTDEAKKNTETVNYSGFWAMRTPDLSDNLDQYNNTRIRLVSTSPFESEYAYISVAIRPLCNLPQDFAISDKPNSNGNYTLYSSPTISGQNEDLGEKLKEFSYVYRVSQPEGGEVTVKESLDDVIINTRTNVQLNTDLSFTIPKSNFDSLSNNATHTLKITAEYKGMTAIRTVTFKKKVISSFTITLKNPKKSGTQPKRCNISVNRNIPSGATFKCEATNNPFDALPVWEDCTKEVENNLIHVFRNETNVSDQYGLNIRVTVQKGTATEICWVSSIGGAFD